MTPKPEGRPFVEAWGTGEPRREFMYSEDMADACVFLMNLGGKKLASSLNPQTSIINIGTGEDITIRELTQIVVEVVGYQGEVRWDTTKPDGMLQKLLDVSMLEGLGWRYKTSLAGGLHQTYQDFLKKHTRR